MFSFTKMRIGLLEESLEEHTSALVGHLHQYILGISGLLPLLQALGEWDPKVSAPPPFPAHDLS